MPVQHRQGSRASQGYLSFYLASGIPPLRLGGTQGALHPACGGNERAGATTGPHQPHRRFIRALRSVGGTNTAIAIAAAPLVAGGQDKEQGEPSPTHELRISALEDSQVVHGRSEQASAMPIPIE